MKKQSKPAKVSTKKLESINDAIFSSVKAKEGDFHPWEHKLTSNNLYFKPISADRIVKNISYPSPSMLTVQGLLTNYHFSNKELYNICNPVGYVKRIKSGTNPPKNQPGFIYDIKDDTVKGFDSQISFWISQEVFNGNSKGIFKVKIFNNVNGVGKIQIPGIKNIKDAYKIVKFIRNFINNQNIIYHKLHYLLLKLPAKLLKIVHSYIKPIINIPNKKDIYEFGYSRKCIMKVPAGKLINFNNLNNTINTIYNNQRLNEQTNFINNFNMLQYENIIQDKKIKQLIYNAGRNPLYDIVWPISGPPEDNKGQRKCTFLIFNPRFGNDEKKYSTIVFNSVPKDSNGKNITMASNGEFWEYSILMNGSADIRHINYIHRFIWELLNCFQDYIFYNKNDNIYTEDNLNTYRKIIELENTLFR
jgi:hypothetical protein